MPNEQQALAQITPARFSIRPDATLYKGQGVTIELRSGLTTLVGPNATGKTSLLKRLRDALRQNPPSPGKFVVYLSAGRGSSLEQFRSSVEGPQGANTSPAAVGHMSWVQNWWQIEGASGVFMRLKERADLLLKVEARLQILQQRRIRFDWSQNGLQIKFVSTAGGLPYFANTEASGLIQLIPLLAAIYDDQISVLLIDEPEVSLHPQLQAFLLHEIRAVAGMPTEVGSKKLVVIATHSPSMLQLRKIADVTNFVFFRGRDSLPLQVATDASELQSRKLGALISRLSENYKLAFFAANVLLVEGPSDEILVGGLSHTLDHPLLRANTQIVPVIGKGEFTETIKLFRLMGKRVCIMADLDALVDDNAVVLSFENEAAEIVNRMGHGDLASLDRSLRNDFSALVTDDWQSIQERAEMHHYWTDGSDVTTEGARRRRAALAVLLVANEDEVRTLKQADRWASVRQRYQALLDALDQAGCIILRRGTIEDYYTSEDARRVSTKTEAAAFEVNCLSEMNVIDVRSRYADAVRALEIAAPIEEINENDLLREQLGSLVGAALQIVTVGMPDDELNTRAASNSSSEQPVFRFENKTVADGRGGKSKRVSVGVLSPLFTRPTFPFEIGEGDNPTSVIREKLP